MRQWLLAIILYMYTFPLTATLNVQRSVVGYGSESENIKMINFIINNYGYYGCDVLTDF